MVVLGTLSKKAAFYIFKKEGEQELSYLGKVLQGILRLEWWPVISLSSGLTHP